MAIVDGKHSGRYGVDAEIQRVEFREQGSPDIHEADGLSLANNSVEFDTEYCVAPGSRLRLSVTPDYGDPELGDIGVDVIRVDSRPGDRFRVLGRLHSGR